MPGDRWFCAVEDIEDAIFGLHDFLDGGSGEEEERLEFAEMEQAHEGVHVGGGEEHAADRSTGSIARWRSELRRGKDLRAQVRGGAEEEPDTAVRRKGELSLSACGGLDGAGAEAQAVAAGAVPLRETAASSGAEDLDLHMRER